MYRVDKGEEFARIMKTVQGDVKKAGERCVNDLRRNIYKDMFKIEIPK
jgi:hypothetical protein